MKRVISLLAISVIALSGCSQDNSGKRNKKSPQDVKVGGRCEDCEAIYESPVPFTKLKSIDTLPGFNSTGPKIEINGVIYKSDGVTPAAEVVLYVYHTDQEGRYPKINAEKEMAGRHGYIRAWIKTDTEGRYKFYTLVPASYPNSNNPKHIHAIIKETGKTEYWIDDFLFADDPLLPKEKSQRPRGGDGILQTTKEGSILKATRNIILGKNVTDYPG